jgi:hypothetical protein
MLRAVARRDNPAFEYWRARVKLAEDERERLYPLLYEVFRAAVELRFAGDEAPERIRAFLRQPRLLLWPDQGFAVDRAEALIRSALGEPGLVSGFTTEDVVVIRMQTLTYLVEDMALDEPQLDALIGRSERWVAANP